MHITEAHLFDGPIDKSALAAAFEQGCDGLMSLVDVRLHKEHVPHTEKSEYSIWFTGKFIKGQEFPERPEWGFLSAEPITQVSAQVFAHRAGMGFFKKIVKARGLLSE